MLLSRRCEYALRTALYLAAQPPGVPTPVRAVSRALGVPHAFLAKTVRPLIAAGFVGAQPGKGGGLTLARPATAVRLKEVVLAVDGPALFEACVLRLPGCGVLQPCPLHDAWVAARERIDRMFSATTLAALSEATQARGLRLSEALEQGG